MSPKRHISRKKSRSPSYDKPPLPPASVKSKHVKRSSPVTSDSSNSLDNAPPPHHADDRGANRSYMYSSTKADSKLEKKRHSVKMKKSQKRPHSKTHKKKKKKKKARSVSSSPPVAPPVHRSLSTTPSPSPSTSVSSTSKKARNISSHMSDTSLFAELVRGKHFKKKKEDDEDVNGNPRSEHGDNKADEAGADAVNHDTDSSKFFAYVFAFPSPPPHPFAPLLHPFVSN